MGNQAQTEAGAFTTAVTKYYYFGSKRVAMRGPDDAVVWLHGDHLGSTSLATNDTGGQVSRQLYYPFGGTRWTSVASLPTDFQFTGQRNQSKIALYDYHARFYDPYLNRFISADSIVPSSGNPQHFNRYSYVSNNPLAFTDPGGHEEWTGDGGGEAEYAKQFHRPGCYSYSSGWGSGWGAGFTLQDVENTVILLGILVAAMAAPEIAAATPEWILAHPTEAIVLKAIGEEGAEAALTGTPFDPRNVALDILSQAGDDFMPRRTAEDLYAFGGKTKGPRPPRAGRDLFPDDLGMVGPEEPPFPNGASTFADPNEAPLTGHYHRLPAGTQLSDGLSVVADGVDVNAASPHPSTHHTIYPMKAMPFSEFVEAFGSLPWEYAGKKQ